MSVSSCIVLWGIRQASKSSLVRQMFDLLKSAFHRLGDPYANRVNIVVMSSCVIFDRSAHTNAVRYFFPSERAGTLTS